MSVRVLLWVHDDDLSPAGPARVAYPQAPAIYVFAPEVIAARGYGLKRLAWIAEALADWPHPAPQLWRGPLVATLRQAAAALGADRIAATASPCPCLGAAITALAIRTLAPVPLADAPRPQDLGRFSRYWKRAAESALRPTAEPPIGPDARSAPGAGTGHPVGTGSG